jgi:hypothetical protein
MKSDFLEFDTPFQDFATEIMKKGVIFLYLNALLRESIII